MVANLFKYLSENEYLQVAGSDWPDYISFKNSDNIDLMLHDELSKFFIFEKKIDTFINDLTTYEDLLLNSYFHICADKQVLEIGPSIGVHTKFICENNPSKLVVIEGDRNCLPYLQQYKIDNIIIDDVFMVLNKKEKFDVVVCFGVLYHLPHSLHLLELIVNYNTPEYVLLDCTNDGQKIDTLPEISNIPGNRQNSQEWKTCGLNLVLPFETIEVAMKNLGYLLVQRNSLSIKHYFPKSNSWMAMFKKLPESI